MALAREGRGRVFRGHGALRQRSGLRLGGVRPVEGCADQAHSSRTTRRTTGFSPTDFAQRYVEDEAFWMYRLWV
ncbi:hypothetical protein AB4Y45_14125 [Paraburkholderia sp. EG287A]|uniref:hypothetical protein n=1 Tax=unclassified Paraburkholderia TaxID=2615204 RepID=UPI0034D2EF67